MAVSAETANRWLKIVARIALIAGVLVLAAWMLAIILRPSLPTQRQTTAAAREQAALTGGARVYAVHCGACHEKSFGPGITGRSDIDAPTITAFVRNGPGAMPAFPETQVSDQDIAELAGWLKDQPLRPVAEPGK